MIDRLVSRIGVVAREGVDSHRCVAVQALGDIATPECGPPLLDALSDQDEDVRVDAAVALGKLPGPAAGGALLESLIGDPCGDVKVAALHSLIAMRHAPVLAWLKKLVVVRPADFVWDPEAFFREGWDDWLDLQLVALDGLGALGAGEAIPEILEAMEDEEGQEITEQALAAFARMGSEGCAAIVALIESGSPRTRRRVAYHLGMMATVRSEGALSRLLADDDLGVRLEAARSLHRTNPADPRLVPLLADECAEMRALAVSLIGMYDTAALPELLVDEDPRVIEATLRVLCEHPLKPLAARIAEIWDEGLVGDRLLALRALAATAPESAIHRIEVAVGSDGDPLVDPVLSLLLDMAKEAPDWPNPAGSLLLGLLTPNPADPSDRAMESGQDDEPGALPESTGRSTLEEILAPQARARQRPRQARDREPDRIRVRCARLLAFLPQDDVFDALARVCHSEAGELEAAALASALTVAGSLAPQRDRLEPFVTRYLPQDEAPCRAIVLMQLAEIAGEADWLQERLVAEIERGPEDSCEVMLALPDKTAYWDDLIPELGSPSISRRLAVAEAIAGSKRKDRTENLVRFAFMHEGEHWRQAADLIPVEDRDLALENLYAALVDETARERWPVATQMIARLCRNR